MEREYRHHTLRDATLGNRDVWVFPGTDRIVVYADGNTMFWRAPLGGRGWEFPHLETQHTAVLVSNGGPLRPDTYAGDLSQHYLNVIGNCVLPFVQRAYGIAGSIPTHAGASLGGLLTIEALLTQPTWLQGIALSPTIRGRDNWAFERIRTLVDAAPAGACAGKELYLDMGTDPIEPGRAHVERVAELLRTTGLTVHTKIEKNDRHTETAWSARLPGALTTLRAA